VKVLVVSILTLFVANAMAQGLHHELQCQVMKSNKQPLYKSWPLLMAPLPGDKPETGHFSDGIYDVSASSVVTTFGPAGGVKVGQIEVMEIASKTVVGKMKLTTGGTSPKSAGELEIPSANIDVSCGFWPNTP